MDPRFSPKVLLKWLGISCLLFAYLITSGLISILPLSKRRRRSWRARSTSFFSARALAVFNVLVRVKRGAPFRRRPEGCLVVSNHVSYIDVLVISSLAPSVFITSVELKNTPLLGLLARFGGSLFVERRKPSGLRREIGNIACVLEQGFSVVLFPEGTTSGGDRVQDFKNALFHAAITAGAGVLPLCLRYTAINKQPVSSLNKDNVYYYGGISFSRHFPAFMAMSSVEVEVVELKSIYAGSGTSRKELAEQAYFAINSEYQSL